MTSQRLERTWIRTGGYRRFRGEWVKRTSLLTPLSNALLRRGLLVLWGGCGERKRECPGHDVVHHALSIFLIIAIFIGIPSGSLCGSGVKRQLLWRHPWKSFIPVLACLTVVQRRRIKLLQNNLSQIRA